MRRIDRRFVQPSDPPRDQRTNNESDWIREATKVCQAAAKGNLEARVLNIDESAPIAPISLYAEMKYDAEVALHELMTDDFGVLADNKPADDGVDTDSDGICDAAPPTTLPSRRIDV